MFTDAQTSPLTGFQHQGHATSSRDIPNGWILSGQASYLACCVYVNGQSPRSYSQYKDICFSVAFDMQQGKDQEKLVGSNQPAYGVIDKKTGNYSSIVVTTPNFG